MRLLASESYNVAWFKLADFVARGEKERALSVHKLLMHSVQDEAIPYQLEGDILLAFDDESALDRYHVAANLYKKSGKMKQAASVYEHVCLFKQDERILEALFDLYIAQHDEVGALHTFSRLAKVCLKGDNFGFISNLFHRYLLECDEKLQGQLSIRFVSALLLYDENNKQLCAHIYQTIDILKQTGKEEELFTFLSQLEDLDSDAYQKAQQYIDNNS